jgi:hypothetical protein
MKISSNDTLVYGFASLLEAICQKKFAISMPTKIRRSKVSALQHKVDKLLKDSEYQDVIRSILHNISDKLVSYNDTHLVDLYEDLEMAVDKYESSEWNGIIAGNGFEEE